MEPRNPNTGLPVAPADAVMRGTHGADNHEQFAVRHRHAHLDGHSERPMVVRGAAGIIAAVVAALWLASCGGKVEATVNPTAEVPVEIRWIKEVCAATAHERVEEMNRINNELLDEAFVLVACPGVDPLETVPVAVMVDGVPALAVSTKVLYLFPGMGEQVRSMAPAQSAAGRMPLARLGATQ